MIVLGVTGSIGMGKSTVCTLLRRLGVPVHDADAAVHRLFAPGGAAVAPVAAAFPGVVTDGAIDRAKLGARVFGDAAALKRLERIVHPLVHREERRFLRRMRRQRVPIVAIDVPLLYETGGVGRCDYVLVVSAPFLVQRQRVLRRPGMTGDKFRAILARQMPDTAKRRRADYVVPSGLGKAATMRALKRILADIRRREGRGRDA